MPKAIELLAESERGREEAAAAHAVANAAKTLHGIESIRIEHMEGKVHNDRLVKYRIDSDISFLLERRGHWPGRPRGCRI